MASTSGFKKFKWSRAGYVDLMDGGLVQGELQTIAREGAAVATSMLSADFGPVGPDDEHFTVEEVQGTMARGYRVFAHTEHAKRSCNKNKTLTKAFNSLKW